jgi:hypothetical protein
LQIKFKIKLIKITNNSGKNMNEKDPSIDEKIAQIKNKKLREELLKSLKNEGVLDFLNLATFLTENASKRFKKKIENCQKIEKVFSNIPSGDYHLLFEKLGTLIFQLATLYADDVGNEITEEKSNYKEIKDYIINILKFKNIQLKLQYFNITIELFKKNTANIEADPQLNKEFTGALDLLKKFVTEENYIPNKEDLDYVSNFGRETNEVDIRKYFYGIIHNLDKKLLFRDLLNQLLEILKNQNKIPLMQFSSIFITMCLNDQKMDDEAFYQVIDLVCQVLKRYDEHVIMKNSFNDFKKIFNQKNLSDYLTEFEKDFQEKIPQAIINNLSQSARAKEHYRVENILKELDFVIYFPVYINSKKIELNLSLAKVEFIQTLEKRIVTNDHSLFKYFREGLSKITSNSNKIVTNIKALASDAKENLEEFTEANVHRLTDLIRKKSDTLHLEESEKIYELTLNKSLIQAKEKLLSIKEKLNAWTSILNDSEPHDNYYNQIDTGPIDLEPCLESIAALDVDINDKYSLLIPEILNIFEEIITNMKEKDYWFTEHEINKSSLAYKIFHRGYFNKDFSIKKINEKLGNSLSFDKINDFISTQNFWTLLFYGIVRWPWMNKIIFSRTWAEQLSLHEVITQTEELKKELPSSTSLKKIMDLLENFPSFKKETIIKILYDFKKNIVVKLTELEVLEKEIDRLNETKNSLSVFSSITQLFSKKTASVDPDRNNFVTKPHC